MVDSLREVYRTQRQKLELTQREIAFRGGIQQRQVTDFERGNKDLRLSTLLKLATALELELVAVPKADINKVRALLVGAKPESPAGAPPSLLEHYQVKGEEGLGDA